MKTIALYCLDQDKTSTSSRGICNYTRQIIKAMSKLDYPGFNVELWVSSANVEFLVPQVLPSWMTVQIAKGNYGRGFIRIFADQILAAIWPVLRRVSAVHFPKGWIPFWWPSNIPRIATIHDTIVFHYLDHYPDHSLRKMKYFANCTKFTLKKAAKILTVSNSSLNNLVELIPSSQNRLSLTVEGVGIDLDEFPYHRVKKEDQVLIIGSTLPHKATATTVNLISKWRRTKDVETYIKVVGLESYPSSWTSTPDLDGFSFVGKLSDDALASEIAKSRALVILSEIEGFGLPALEAYALGTPVVYHNTSSLKEILVGLPGGWNGGGENEFNTAMNEVLELGEYQIEEIRQLLLDKYNWTLGVEQILSNYRNVLGLE